MAQPGCSAIARATLAWSWSDPEGANGRGNRLLLERGVGDHRDVAFLHRVRGRVRRVDVQDRPDVGAQAQDVGVVAELLRRLAAARRAVLVRLDVDEDQAVFCRIPSETPRR